MEPIRKSESQKIEGWDLSTMGITAIDIPASRVRNLATSTNSSAGVLKKFNVTMRDEEIYVKSGSSTGRIFNIRHPIIERISSIVGRLLVSML